jgi:regulator of sigma E protease
MDFQSLFSNTWSFVLVVIFFGGSIFVHELGHFLAARRRGLKIERFSIGFGPKIFSWVGKDGVEYRLSWIPLGGYVALPQLADLRQLEGEAEVSDADRAAISYSAKVEVLVAGAAFNVLFALGLACLIWVTGYPIPKSDLTTRVGYIAPALTLPDGREVASPAKQAGIQVGDTIKSVDGHSVDRWRDVQQSIMLGDGRTADGKPQVTLIVERAGSQQALTVHPLLVGDVDKVRTLGIAPVEDLTIKQAVANSPAEKAGVLPGDVLQTFNGIPVFNTGYVHELVQKNRDKPVALVFDRAGKPVSLQITPREESMKVDRRSDAQESIWLLGLRWSDSTVLVKDPPFRQIGEHVVGMWRTVGALLSRDSDVGLSKMSGPVGIGRGFHQMAQIDWRLLLWFTILINVNLALMNLLPIPVLDGGHLLFATIARLRGRPLPHAVLAKVTTAFLLVIMTTILYITTFDVRRWISDLREEPTSPAPAKPAAQPPSDPAPAKP